MKPGDERTRNDISAALHAIATLPPRTLLALGKILKATAEKDTEGLLEVAIQLGDEIARHGRAEAAKDPTADRMDIWLTDFAENSGNQYAEISEHIRRTGFEPHEWAELDAMRGPDKDKVMELLRVVFHHTEA